MRSVVQHRRHRWPWLLAAGVASLCASTALASRRLPASDLRAALTTSPAASPTATPATLPAATFTLDPAAGITADLAAYDWDSDLDGTLETRLYPLQDDQGTVHAVADGDGVIAESYLVRQDGTVQIYGSDRTPPRLVLGRVRPLVAGQPQTLQLVFSEDVQATGATAVALSGPGGTPHPLTLDPASGRVWTATLDPTLLPGDAFTLTVSGVEDLAGNQILPQSLPFVAPEPALGLVLPGTAEADLLAVLDGPTGLALVLGTPVDPGAIPASLVSVKRAGLAVAGSVSVHTGGAQPLEGAVLMWTPTDPQAYQPGACEVTIAAGLVDLAGHPIHGPPDAIAYDHSGQGDVVWARPEDAPILSASQAGNDRFLHGRPLVATLGLYDHRARFYDPTTQTFLEPDPLGSVDSPNLYQAFGLDPQNNTDPLGTCVGPLPCPAWIEVGLDWAAGMAVDAAQRAFSAGDMAFAQGRASGFLAGERAFLMTPGPATGRLAAAVTAYDRQRANVMTLGFSEAPDKLAHAGQVTGVGQLGQTYQLFKQGEYLASTGKALEGAGTIAGWALLAYAPFAASTPARATSGPKINLLNTKVPTNAGPAELAQLSGVVSLERSLFVGPFRSVSGLLGDNMQANHLNQNAAFGSVIPRSEGASVAMRGSAFSEQGSPHYLFHESLESFWTPYRRGGALFGARPTIAQYDAALGDALRAAGIAEQEASVLLRLARANRTAYGLSDPDPVPQIPRRTVQKAGPNP